MPTDSSFTPRDKEFRARVAASFARQAVMNTLGISLARVDAGEVELHFAHRDDLVQQHGFLHAGVVTCALDSACGYAAFSLMQVEAAVLTVDFNVHLLSPAQGERFVAFGKVVKAGRTISVADGEAFAIHGAQRKLIARMSATLMTVVGRDDVRG